MLVVFIVCSSMLFAGVLLSPMIVLYVTGTFTLAISMSVAWPLLFACIYKGRGDRISPCSHQGDILNQQCGSILDI